jgi:dolichyl-phosphate-mannose-protein mannosyltransferase
MRFVPMRSGQAGEEQTAARTAPPQAGALRNLPGRIVSLVRRNRLFAVALAAGAAVRAVAMLGYPGTIWFPGDSYLYLGAALRPRPDLSKTVGYSFWLRLLEPFHSLTLVAAAQHLMGLAVAVMIYALLRRARLPRWGAALATLPVLLDGFEIQLEHMAMSETVFTFAVALGVTLLMWRDRPSWPVALLAGLLAGYAVLVRSVGIPVLAVFALYLLLPRRPPERASQRATASEERNGGGRRRTLRWRGWRPLAAVVAGLAIPVVAYAAWFHSVNGQYALTRSDGFYLFGRVSSFSECAAIKPPPAEQRLCYSTPPAKRQAPGQLVWVTPNARKMPGGPVSPSGNRLLRDFAIRAITAQPAGYAGAIADGLRRSADWNRSPYPGAYTYNHYKFPYHPQHVPANHSWIPGGTAAHDVHAYGRASPSRVVKPWAPLIRRYQRYIFTYGPLFGALMLAGLIGVGRRWRTLGGAGLLPTATAVVLLVFPIAAADFDYRYLLPVLPFACLAAGLAFAPDSLGNKAPASSVTSSGRPHDDTAQGSTGAGPQERAGVA